MVHLVGDLHQPFHALSAAQGGNDIPLVAFGSPTCSYSGGTPSPCNLHGLWETSLIAHRRPSDQQYLDVLSRLIDAIHLKKRSRREVDVGHSDLIVISTFPSAADAQLAKGVLDDARIDSMIRADDGGGMYPAMGGVDLLVRADDVQKAQEALDAQVPDADVTE